MSSTRTVGVGAGWRWLVDAANLGAANPGAVFGGAALMLVAVIGVALAAGVVVSLVMAGTLSTAAGAPPAMPSFGTMFAIQIATMVPVLLLMACFMVGFLRLVHAVEQGRQASATDVFAGFRDWPVSLRVFGFMVVLGIVQNLLIVLLVSVVSPDFADFYVQLVQAAPGTAPPEMAQPPAGMFGALSIVWLLSLAFYAVQAIGFGELAIRGAGIGRALGAGVSGTVRNLLPLLLLMLIGIALAIVLAVVLFLVVLVVMLLVNAVGAWIGFVIGVPLYLLFVLMLLVFAFGVMYCIWRDIAGADMPAGDAGPALPADRVEI